MQALLEDGPCSLSVRITVEATFTLAGADVKYHNALGLLAPNRDRAERYQKPATNKG